MASWVQKLQLAAHDAIFDGQEAARIRAQLRSPELTKAPPTSCEEVSLLDQGQLALDMAATGRWDDALAAAASFPLHAFGDAGKAVLTAANMRSAVQAMNAFAPLLGLRHQLIYKFRQDESRIGFQDFIELDARMNRLLLDLDKAKIGRFVGELIPAAANDATSRRVSGRGPLLNVNWQGDELVLHGLPATDTLPGYSRLVNQGCQRKGRWKMRDMEERALCESVRRLLAKERDTVPSLASVAEQLHMSSRTFRRQLAEQGTSFMQVLSEVRCELALHYLATSDMTTEDIAQRLGYSESANFRHAFRRWTGTSPRRYGMAARCNGHAQMPQYAG